MPHRYPGRNHRQLKAQRVDCRGGLLAALLRQPWRSATQGTGLEYVVQTDNGNLITLVQGKDTTFTVERGALVLYGSPSRIIPDLRR